VAGEKVIEVGSLPSFSELKASGVKNLNKRLQPAPCVKDRQSGRLFIWHPIFAERSDKFVCCDETGDEDPSAWMGRGPEQFRGFPRPDEGALPPEPDADRPGFTVRHPVISDNVVGRRFVPPDIQ
jgi:hypothetical protein